MKTFSLLMQTVLALSLAIVAGPASATLTNSFQFNGNGNWSIDAVGSNSTPVGDLTAIVPTGSTVEQAFLYSSTLDNENTFVPSVNFDGATISGADWTNLGVNLLIPGFGLQAFRADVTAQVAAKVGGGSATPFTFSILSENPNGNIDGEVLAIVYSNPAEQERTIAFLDGFSTTTGDMTSINLLDPLTAAQLADPNFEALLSLGIGFSFRPSGQFSEVDINGMRLTSDAGGQDDGIPTTISNGGLITAGGIGDNPANPADPLASNINDPLVDDELYDLEPFLSAGDSQITINTLNPSNDDNIFFAGINITAVAGVNQPPPPRPGVPEPATVLLMGMGLASIGAVRRRRQSR